MTVPSRKSRQFELRGQEILDAALALFQSDTWEEVTVAEIAQQAEVGKGTIYKHFSSKDEIYAQLAMNFQRQILVQFAKVDTRLPVIDRFRQYLKAAWEVHLSSQELHRVFLYCSRAGFRSRLQATTLTELEGIEYQLSLPTQQLVALGMEQGIFPRKPLPLLLFGAQSAFWGAIQLVWSGYLGDIDQSDYLEELTTFILAGLIYHDQPIDAQRLPSRPPS
ncbi:TetR/AcrR family transcriptional regulator [Pseudomonas benzenivorans]|uniref:TetR/AcrR family transcriptional regulator n=1 Tax=Pseudomonas benzenivorans TaxID=556533 RepID=A0ABY5HAP6_9PSED|nr:TetR/AcrR family transcriptional regulator [Pseudomonas benzenivorans]UTW08462.1 TetR/AcrR family transcriptional regulator [Pseudomonas benzenivorans]